MVRDQFRRIWWKSFGRDAANREPKQRRWQWERLLKRWICALSNFLASIGPFRFCKWNQFLLEFIFKDFIQVQKEKIRRSMFTSSIKHDKTSSKKISLRSRPVNVKNVLKGWRMSKAVVLLKKPIVFWRCRCRFRLRRGRCLSSLIFLITDIIKNWIIG